MTRAGSTVIPEPDSALLALAGVAAVLTMKRRATVLRGSLRSNTPRPAQLPGVRYNVRTSAALRARLYTRASSILPPNLIQLPYPP